MRADSGANAFGLERVQVAGGILTTKPFEYAKQVPEGFNAPRLDGTDYVDIRGALQENPLIRMFGEKSGLSIDVKPEHAPEFRDDGIYQIRA